MGVKPGYKQTEVGAIPNEWDVKPLGQVGKSLIGLTYRPEDVRDHGTLVLRSSNIQEGALRFDDNVFVQKDIPERIMVCPGDILVCVRNGSRDLIGKSALLDERAIGMTFGAFMAVFRSSSGLFINYLFQSEILKKQINEHLGATINQITNKSLNSFLVPLPSTDSEQRAIATALSDVDALLGALDRLIAKKRDLKQAAMQKLLTGQTRLPDFHGEWEVKRLGDVTHLIPSGIYGEEKPRAGLIASLVATTAHIDEDDSWNTKEMATRYFTIEKIQSYATAEGDLIVVKSSGSAAKIQSGKIGFVDSERAEKFLFSNFLMLLRPTAIAPKFLYFYLCSHNVKKLLPTLVEASTYPNIRLDDYLDVEIPVPSPAEQAAISEVLTDMNSELTALEQRLTKTRALKQAMMQELLTGKTRLVSPKTDASPKAAHA